MPENMEEREGVEYTCKLIYEAYRVPVMWLDAADTPRLTLPPAFECRPAVQGAHSLLQEVMDIARRSSPAATAAGKAARTAAPPYLHTTGFLENFIILQLPEADHAGGAILIGPVLSAPVTGDNAASLMRDYSIPPGQQEGWQQYYRSLPVLSRMRWYHAALLLYTLATGEALSITELLLAAGNAEQSVPQPDDSPDLDLSYRRENTWLHHDPMLEREMFRHIANGDKAGLLRTQASFSEESYGRLSKKSQLRSKKTWPSPPLHWRHAQRLKAGCSGRLPIPSATFTSSILKSFMIFRPWTAPSLPLSVTSPTRCWAAAVRSSPASPRCARIIFTIIYMKRFRSAGWPNSPDLTPVICLSCSKRRPEPPSAIISSNSGSKKPNG